MLTLGEYDFGVIVALSGIQATEVALRIRLKATSVTTFAALIKMSAAGSLLSAEAINVMDAGRQLRNLYAHPHERIILTIPMARDQVRSSQYLMADLYP